MTRLVAPLIVALLCACGDQIGDDCKTSADCSPDGDRICDRSMPGGYCTIEGCDRGTCPGEATCIRFFPVSSLTTACCLTCDEPCAPDQTCLSDGFCAPRISERRYCMRVCGEDFHCRDGYVCRQTGMAGAELAQAPDDLSEPEEDPVGRFCGPPLPFR